MIPRQDMVCIYQNSSFNEIMELVKLQHMLKIQVIQLQQLVAIQLMVM
mgnify:CR=1 FL=1